MPTRQDIRPQIDSIQSTEQSPVEHFMHHSLRPILKMQHELLRELFLERCHRYKNQFFKIPDKKQLAHIQQALRGNGPFPNNCRGIVLGQLTLEELQFFLKHKAELDKRLRQMTATRLESIDWGDWAPQADTIK